MRFKLKNASLSFVAVMLLIGSMGVGYAAPPKGKATYSEQEFLTAFSGKTKGVVTSKLGDPVRKEQSVKPSGASTIIGQLPSNDKNSKPVKVEMWYYKNIVKYDAKHTYKETEITFVNDRAMNIAFVNSK